MKLVNYRPHPKDGEGNVFSLSTLGGGYPYPIMLCNISQNAMGQPGGVPCQVLPGGYPARSSWGVPWLGGTLARGVPWPGGYPGQGVPWLGGVPWPGVPWLGGTLARGGTLAGGVPWPGGVPWLGGTLARGYPDWGVPWPGEVPWLGGYPAQGGTLLGGTQLGQHREYLLYGGRYASCVHAGGLSCCNQILGHVKIRIGKQNCICCRWSVQNTVTCIFTCFVHFAVCSSYIFPRAY